MNESVSDPNYILKTVGNETFPETQNIVFLNCYTYFGSQTVGVAICAICICTYAQVDDSHPPNDLWTFLNFDTFSYSGHMFFDSIDFIINYR